VCEYEHYIGIFIDVLYEAINNITKKFGITHSWTPQSDIAVRSISQQPCPAPVRNRRLSICTGGEMLYRHTW
jgi:hypothetical protein